VNITNLCFIAIKNLLFWDSVSSGIRLKLGHSIPPGEHCEHDSRTRDECNSRRQVETRIKQGGAAKYTYIYGPGNSPLATWNGWSKSKITEVTNYFKILSNIKSLSLSAEKYRHCLHEIKSPALLKAIFRFRSSVVTACVVRNTTLLTQEKRKIRYFEKKKKQTARPHGLRHCLQTIWVYEIQSETEFSKA
jgi:hypothetical protein